MPWQVENNEGKSEYESMKYLPCLKEFVSDQAKDKASQMRRVVMKVSMTEVERLPRGAR
jgi:hypothetical protein